MIFRSSRINNIIKIKLVNEKSNNYQYPLLSTYNPCRVKYLLSTYNPYLSKKKSTYNPWTI